jgi:hypothetical protein
MENTLDTFRVGDRVQTHPATDSWMAGDRYGTVVAIRPRHGIPRYSVDLDRSGKTVLFHPNNLLHV